MATDDVLSSRIIRDIAGDLEDIVRSVAIQPTEDNMRILNCAWARATRLLSQAPKGKGAA